MVSTRGIKVKFFAGERVLCYEPDPTKAKVLYDSKVLDIVSRKDQTGKKVVEYLIHFQGWNSSWDRCVGEEYVLKDTVENRQLQKDLAEKAQLQLGAYLYRKERKKQKSGDRAVGSSEEGSSGSPAQLDTDDNPEMTTSSDENSSLEDESIEIEIIPELREILESDYYLINGKHKRMKLPCEPSVVAILEAYYKHYGTNQICGLHEKSNSRYKNHFTKDTKPRTEDIQKNLAICREVVDGLRIYFDFTLNDLLLYEAEKGPELLATAPAIMQPPGLSDMKIDVKNESNTNNLENNSGNRHNNHLNQNGVGESSVNARRRTLRSNNKSECHTNGNSVVEESNGASYPKPCSSVGSSNSDINSALAKVLSWHLLPEHVYNQQPPPPSLVYGATHFTRLFVKLPEMFTASSIPETKMKIILRHVDSIIDFLNEHKEWYGEKFYVDF